MITLLGTSKMLRRLMSLIVLNAPILLLRTLVFPIFPIDYVNAFVASNLPVIRHGSSNSSNAKEYLSSVPNAAEIYVRHWEHLLQEEHHAATTELKERRKHWSRQRLQSSGVSMFDVSAEPDSEVYGEKLVRIYLDQNRNGDNQGNYRNWSDLYNRGDVLTMTPMFLGGKGGRPGFPASRRRKGQRFSSEDKSSSGRGNQEYMPREVSVVDVGRDWMTVSAGQSWPAGLWESRKQAGSFQVQLDRTVPQSSLIAQKKALDLVRRSKAGRAAQLLVDTFDSNSSIFGRKKERLPNKEFVSTDLRAWPPTIADDTAAQVPPYLRYHLVDDEPLLLNAAIAAAIREAKKKSSFQPNKLQEEAIAWALQRSLSLIRGPPGTGKTLCAALLISAAIRLQLSPKANLTASTSTPRVLAVAHSNGAADVLLQALLDMGVPAVRVGRPATVSPSLRHRTVVAMAEKHPEVKRLRANVVDKTLDTVERSIAAYEVGRCMNDIRCMISSTAPVVVASCIGANQLMEEISSRAGHDGPVFQIVVLDEAAQSTEPALLCALAASKAEQAIFVGDTRQLPPTVASESKKLRDGLGVSPMARLEISHVGERTLGVQYRMVPALLQFPSQYFYDGLVTCADSISQSSASGRLPPPKGFPWPKSLPLAFVQLGGNLETNHDYGGKSNPTEADLVVKIVNALIVGREVTGSGVAVITPYAKQVQLIRALLSSRNIKGVKVGTVDSFQGQETEIVIFSAVRSNILSDIGFLRDPRRLCVALTRAKRGLIVVGDQLVLQTSRPWRALIESCQKRGCMLSKEDVSPLSRTANEIHKATTQERASSDAALFAALEASLEGDDGLQDLFDEVKM